MGRTVRNLAEPVACRTARWRTHSAIVEHTTAQMDRLFRSLASAFARLLVSERAQRCVVPVGGDPDSPSFFAHPSDLRRSAARFDARGAGRCGAGGDDLVLYAGAVVGAQTALMHSTLRI